ncbi:MAG: hypothetical protein AMXMBFR47_32590 [Planctomycetota bacterium]
MSAEPSTDGLWGCAKCARITQTCCQRAEVLTTAADRARIAAFTGWSDFWEYRAPESPSYTDQDDDPNWIHWGFRPDGTRPILKRRLGGDCVFLSPTGCALPMDIRPLVCRLYPYTYNEQGIDGIDNGCPPEVIPPGSNILTVLDMRRAEADQWHAALYRELREGCDAKRLASPAPAA